MKITTAFAGVFAVLLCAGAADADETLSQCLASVEAGNDAAKNGRVAEAKEAFAACSADPCPAEVRAMCTRMSEKADAPSPSHSPSPSPSPTPTPTPTPAAAPEAMASTSSPPIKTNNTPWYVIGGGGFLIATATVFQLIALREDSDRKALGLTLTRSDLTSSERAAFEQSERSHYDAAHADQGIAITLASLGTAAIISSVTWLLLHHNNSNRPTSAAKAPTQILTF